MLKRLPVVSSGALPRSRRSRRRSGAERDVLARIRDEVNARSQIMRSVHVLADVYGPRLTGSPNLKAAGEWAVATMESWGLTNGRLEPWNFGRDGWVNERFSAHISRPVKDSARWRSAGVDTWHERHGHRARPFTCAPRSARRRTQLSTYLNSVQDHVRGRIVLVDRSSLLPIDMTPPAKREDDDEMRRFDSATSSRRLRNRPRARSDQSNDPPPLTASTINRRIDEFLRRQRRAASASTTPRASTGRSSRSTTARYDVATVVPTVVLRNEDYGRIARLLADGTPVRARVHHRQSRSTRKGGPPTTRRRDRRHRQEGRGRDARRPSRLVARRRPARPTTRSAAR